MTWSLENRCAVCLAASEGLGFGIAREMASAGARTLLVSRNRGRLENAAAAIADHLGTPGPYPGIATTHRPEIFAADLLDDDAPRRIATHAGSLFGKIDVLVNNIGGPKAGRFEDLTDETWNDAYKRLFLTVVRQIRSAYPLLKKSDAPRVLTVTSVSARQPIAGLVLSNTFRPGLMGLAKTLAQEWGPEGILVNNLAPGMFETARHVDLENAMAKMRGVDTKTIREERVKEIPLGRFGSPEELGRVAVFLASPANSYITGQTILVDGGIYRGI